MNPIQILFFFPNETCKNVVLDIKFWPWRHTVTLGFVPQENPRTELLTFEPFKKKKTKKTCWLVKVKILFGIKWFKLELFRISAPAASQMVLINGLCIHLHWQLSTLANNPGNTQLSLLVTGSNDSGESYMRRRHVSPHAACALLPPDHRGVSGFQSCKWLVPGIRSVWTGAGGGRKGTSSES